MHRVETDFTLMNFILNVKYLFTLGLLGYRFLEIRKSRQAKGIARARERNAYKGRQATIDRAEINKLYAELKSVSKVAKAMNICRNSVYRNLEKVA